MRGSPVQDSRLADSASAASPHSVWSLAKSRLATRSATSVGTCCGDGVRRRTGGGDVEGAHAVAFSSSRVTPSSSSPQDFSNLSTPSRSSWAVTSA